METLSVSTIKVSIPSYLRDLNLLDKWTKAPQRLESLVSSSCQGFHPLVPRGFKPFFRDESPARAGVPSLLFSERGKLASIEGQYVDKKGNPISDAIVEYQRDGAIIADDITDANGYFEMDVETIGIDDPLQAEEKKEILLQNYPNPFNGQTTIEASIDEPGKLRIFDMSGKLMSSIDLEKKGDYKISWGGLDAPPGMYIYNFVSKEGSVSKKMISQGSGFSGLDIMDYGLKSTVNVKSTSAVVDSIKFSKPHTTFIGYDFDLQGDTNFVQVGNPGPDVFNPINAVTGFYGDVLEWYLPDHVYNDEATSQFVSNYFTWVSNDTLYYPLATTGIQNLEITITDLTDPSLEALMNVFVYIKNPGPYTTADIPDQNSDEDVQHVINLGPHFKDGNGDKLDYVFHNMLNATVDSIVDTIAYVTPDADWNGTMTDIVVEAKDAQYSAFSNGFDWVVNPVNDAPFTTNTFLGIAIYEDTKATIPLRPDHFDDIDTPVLDYTLMNASSHATHTFTNDTLYIYPEKDWNGTLSLGSTYVRADDGQYTVDGNSFNITVIPVNDAPIVTNPFPGYTVNEDGTLIIPLRPDHFDDIDTPTLDYIVNNLQNATYDVLGGMLYITPDPDWNGMISGVSVTADDGQYQVSSNTFDIEVLPANDAPFVTNFFTDYVIDEDGVLSIPLRPDKFDDIDSPNLDYLVNGLQNASHTLSNDTIYITPDADWNGQISNVVITADDGQYQALGNPFNITVTPVPDLPRQIAVVPDQNSLEDDDNILNMLSFVYNPDSDQMSYVVNNQQNSNFLTNLDEVTLTPVPDWFGVESGLEIVVSNNAGSITLNAFDWTVTNVNDAPFLVGPLDEGVVYEDGVLSIPLRPYPFNDIDSPVLNYTVNGIQNATHNFTNDTMYVYPDADWNGIMPNVVITADDGQYQVNSNSFEIKVLPVPDLPRQIANVPSMTSPEDAIKIINTLNYVYNPDSDQLSFVVNNQQNSDYAYSPSTKVLSLIPDMDWYGVESGLEIVVSNGAGSITLNPYDWTVTSVNDKPVANDDTASTTQDTPVVIDVLLNDNDDKDPNGGLLANTVSELVSPSHGSLNINPVTGEITYTPTPGWHGVDSFAYEVGDNGTPMKFDDAIVTVTVDQAMSEVYFKVMDLMTDTLLKGATLQIGSNSYVLASGDTTLMVPYGTKEVNATHPNTIDWTSIWEEYTAIQRPGQNANVEQRARADYSSQVTFDNPVDTLYVYKVMDDFHMYNVRLIIGSGPQGQTHRFSDNDLNAPAWFNLNYDAPTQTTRERVQYWLPLLKEATKGKLDMVYEEDNTQPSVPYLEMAIDNSFNASNATVVTGNIIDWCDAHWPDNFQSYYSLGIEMLQAVGDLNDIGSVDPPIISLDNGNFVINHTGQECFHLLYNFDPGTRF